MTRKQFIQAIGLLMPLLLLAVVVVAFIPPWWGKSVYLIHAYAGIPYRFQAGWPPESFSGIWRDYGPGQSYDELSYKNGQRDGLQYYYNEKGRLVRTCEFRNGKPWSGLCEFWEYKPWLAEYRNGKVWTGAMQEPDLTSPDGSSMRYYYKGKLYSEADFRSFMRFGTNGSLIGVMCIRWNN
jgi:hypothetical protein